MSTLQRAPGSFVYVAARSDGRRALGRRQARDERDLADGLRRERLLLLKSYRLPAAFTPESRMSLKDQAELHEQLSRLLSRGVPLVEALDVTASAVATAAKPLVIRIRDLVQSGASFADACQGVGVFDTVTIAVYRAAERSGDLAGAGKKLSATARRQLQIAGKATTVAIYPLIVVSVSLVVAFFMLVAIVPRIGEALAAQGAALPWYSTLVMSSGIFLRDNLLAALGVIAAVVVALVVCRKEVGRVLGRVMRRLPLFKDLILSQESAQFFSVMGAMSRAGVPLTDALAVSNQAVAHPALRSQLDTLRARLVEGGILRTLIDGVTALPMSTRRLLIAADRAGDLETAFESLAVELTEEVDRKASRLLAALEPVLIVLMFALIGSVVLSVMIPLLTLAGQTPM